MKISKLFHWLYAVIMLLPIFAIGSTCLISTFNMSSKQESEINYKYETNDVNNANDLVSGNYYRFDTRLFNRIGDESSLIPLDDDFIFFYDIYIDSNNSDISSPNLNFVGSMDYDFTSPVYSCGYQIRNIGQGNVSVYVGLFDTYCGIEGYDLYFVAESESQYYIYSKIYFNRNSQFLNNTWSCFSRCPIEYLPIERVETNNLDTQDIFYNAIDKVRQSPLFTWAYDSFLVAPFAYIVSLFSMPTNSFVVQMLSYWLAISIIWLVFDLIMYVPLLVHRWLDKGVLE